MSVFGDFEKLECLRAHYSSSSVQMDSIPYGAKKGSTWDRLSDDQKGQRCMGEFETACRKTAVDGFVLRGEPLPVIQNIESYERHFLSLEGERLQDLTEIFEGKISSIARLGRQLDEEIEVEDSARREVRAAPEGEAKKKDKKDANIAELAYREAKDAVRRSSDALDKARSERSD